MKRTFAAPLFIALLLMLSCTTQVVYPTLEEATKAVIQMERDALDNWSAGHPEKYSIHMADDASYTDDIMAHELKIGIDDVQAYLNTLEGMIPAHEYEIVNPQVQLYNSVAVLHFHYVGIADGQKGSPWKTTTVYNYSDGEWKMVHANWSLVDPSSLFAPKPASEE